jgi:malonate transporter and related proteins
MHAVANVVLPLFGVILAGFLAGRFKILGNESSEALNRYVYFFALPCLLFLSMARTPTRDVLDGPFIAAYLCGVAVVFAIVIAVGRLAFPARLAQMSLAGLAAGFANTGYMGIPLFLMAYGPAGMPPAVIGAVLNASVLIGAVIVLIELDAHKSGGLGGALRDVGRALVSNPLVLAPFAGLAWSAAGLGIPGPIAAFGDMLGTSSGPCALFAIGLFLATQSVNALMGGKRTVEAAWLIALKLIAQPAATWAFAVLFGLEPFAVAAATILAAMPTGALAFVVAQRYGIFVERTSAVILGSTVVSVVTLSAVMVLFSEIRP